MIVPFRLQLLDASWTERALLLSQEAGWNQNAADWGIFFTRGTVLGFSIDDRLIATSAALAYGNAFGWLSMVLVTEEWRRHGLAKRLVSACTSILRDSGRAALLDASPAATGIYESLGFLPLRAMERWEGEGDGGKAASTEVALDRLASLDRIAFGADRQFLLQDFLSRPGSLLIQSPNGFAILRRGSAASHIGPIIAEPGEASGLLAEAINAASGRVLVDVLDADSALIAMLAARGFRRQRAFTRMALGLSALPGNSAWLQAAAGPEFG